MRFKNLLLGAACAAASAGAAQAAMPTGWYLSLGGGANWVQDADFTVSTFGIPIFGGVSEYETGYIIAGAVGYDWGRWRVEFEVAYRDNDVDCVNLGGGCFPVGGVDLWELSQMVNVLYDFKLGERWGASLGAGVGGNLVVGDGGPFFTSDIDDYVFAGQLIGELTYQLSERWNMFGSYRFMFMQDAELDANFFGPFGTIELEKTEHSVLIGIRFDLQRDGAPPPRAEPPAEPERARQYIVFFGFNKSNLSAEARRVVAEAAAAAKHFGSASIIVVGHTDTVGSNSYNQRLSMRRSGAVKSELVNNGIDDDLITTSGKGETELMVRTGDGVKEPQNRRSTINLQ